MLTENSEIERIRKSVYNCYIDQVKYQAKINDYITDSYNHATLATNLQITGVEIELTHYVAIAYRESLYHLEKVMYYASPGLISILSAIWGVITVVYDAIKWFVEFIHLSEIINMAQILAVIWPEFRERMSKIFAKVSEYSEKIGWGADGLSHLLQSIQSGLNTLGGFLGKDDYWLEFKGADKMSEVLDYISKMSDYAEMRPADVIDFMFRGQNKQTKNELQTWWNDTWETIEEWSGIAENAIIKVNNTIDNLQELENHLPAFVRDNIPDWYKNSINWTNEIIDESLMPAITKINDTIENVNKALESQRQRAKELADKLAKPGDLLHNVNYLPGKEKRWQEHRIDEVAGRKFNRKQSEFENTHKDTFEHLDSLLNLFGLQPETPEFLGLEGVPGKTIKGIVLEEKEDWFVGDY